MDQHASPAAPVSSGLLLWFRRHPCLPLLAMCLAAAVLSMILLVVRKQMTGQARLGFIPFNLVLAFIPPALALLLERFTSRWCVGALAILWLLFFPNAAYMLTDLVHYDRRLGHASWLDLLALLAAGWAALLGGMLSLRLMHLQVRGLVSAGTSAIFAPTVLFLASIGIYIGRFLRFHSWHALLKPHQLLTETSAHYLHPSAHPLAWPFTLGLFALLCVIYYSLVAFVYAAAHRPTPQAVA